MRESIGGAWLLGIVMVFMMIFIAFISVSINYSKAFKLKTDIITIMEEYQGFNSTSIDKIDHLLKSNGYQMKARCKKNEGTVYGVNDAHVTKDPREPQSYCVKRTTFYGDDGEDRNYYVVDVFFGFSLPVLGEVFTFTINGETNPIMYTNDPYFR